MGQYELSQDVIYPSLLSTSEGSIISLSVSTIDKRLEVFEIWIWRHMMKVWWTEDRTNEKVLQINEWTNDWMTAIRVTLSQMNCCGGTLLLFSAPCNSLSTIASLLLQSFNHSFTCNNLASPTCCSLQVGPKISRSATAIVLLFYREGRDAPHPPGRPRPHSLNPSPAPLPCSKSWQISQQQGRLLAGNKPVSCRRSSVRCGRLARRGRPPVWTRSREDAHRCQSAARRPRRCRRRCLHSDRSNVTRRTTNGTQ